MFHLKINIKEELWLKNKDIKEQDIKKRMWGK